MLKGRKYSFMAAFAAAIMVIVAGIVLLTGAQAKSENADYNYVNTRIEKIMSHPNAMIFSNPAQYIEMSKNEYLDIYKLGEKALPALERIVNEEDAKGIHGLRYVLAERIKQDIIKQTNFFDRINENQAKRDEAAVASLVEEFGRKLQTVSLQAPKDIVNKSMQENYGDIVAPLLLAEWVNGPPNAPGRVTSSPWPDRIEILSIEQLSESTYEVKGEIIEMTSVEIASGGVAAKQPITLVVEKVENRWLITAVELGAYE